ncbi:RNA polymerase sigma-70 factor [Solitalea koreensis]|uniref:RNA polymerase sigma-70 factor, ECF subfamily n=1 Tax=Solitalea koreensis TaxID=543615 RepID=A0A521CA40_9SPHI|nr:RNA polymerase sigma-70 factor [Solitalea koreensis]SMO56268.1 RNA polymerase sigma-70 factor, ECF subfamily [Solitalea koreensis]
MDDVLILEQLKADEALGFKNLFDKYYKQLCLQAFILLDNSEEAEDVVQTFFLKLWQEKQYHQIETSLKAYLKSAVRNACLNRIKQRKSFTEGSIEDASLLADENSDNVLENKELQNQIEKALSSLPDHCRKIFTMVALENKKYQEAADELGVSINTVKTQLKRAFSKMREQMIRFK